MAQQGTWFGMRAFLSHSSADSAFIDDVAMSLRPGTYELDSQTFDAGLVNSQAIVEALKRCDLFCLFLSESSVRSDYVAFETLLGTELLARGEIFRFIAVCLDETSFSQASEGVKFFNVVKRVLNPEAAARLIEGNLISALSLTGRQLHPFIGREDELSRLEQQATDHNLPHPRGLFISGSNGAGRRAIARRFYEVQYPSVNRVFPTINIEPFSGSEELFRKILVALRPTLSLRDFKSRLQSFSIASSDERYRQIAQMLNSLLPAREAAFLLDGGGLLTNEGHLEEEISNVLLKVDSRPHPPVVFVALRMIPQKLRIHEHNLCYLAVRSLSHNSSERLMAKMLKDVDAHVTPDQLDYLVNLSDGHPYNFYRIIEEVQHAGPDVFLANTSHFIEWKHRQSSEYIRKLELSDDGMLVLGLLKLFPELDFEALVSALPIQPAAISDVILQLIDLHLVEPSQNRFMISPALRVAVERDRRMSLPPQTRTAAIRAIAETLKIRLEDGTASIALVDAAVLSALEVPGDNTGFLAVFLLPSHYVWLAKARYDEAQYQESIRLAKLAIDRSGRLSASGLVAACRYLCLAASRIGDITSFDLGISKLETSAKGNWARSNLAFLKGFDLRMKGNLPLAETAFRESYNLSPGNTSAAREIAAICLARGNLEEAEIFSREAHNQARSNPYFLDILISTLVRRYGSSAKHSSEIEELFDLLRISGEEEGKSFYTTRKAEFEHMWGDNRTALRLIDVAMKKTPWLFEPKRLYAEILLKEGNNSKAYEVLREMEKRVLSTDPNDRRSNYRAYIETYSHYLVETGRFNEARNLFDDTRLFTHEEREKAVKEIEVGRAYKQK